MAFVFLVCEYYIPCYLLFISARTIQRLALPYCISVSMPFAWFCWLAAQVITLINSRMIIPYKPFLQLNKIRIGGCRCSDGNRAGGCRRRRHAVLADQRPRVVEWNEPGCRTDNPTPCIVVIVPGSVAITYRTHFNYISQSYFEIKHNKGLIIT